VCSGVIDRRYSSSGLISVLIIVLLAVDIAAGVTQFFVKPLTFFWSEPAVGSSESFIDSNSGLLRFKASRFGSRQFTTSDSLTDSKLLSMFNSIDRLCTGDCWYRTQGYSN